MVEVGTDPDDQFVPTYQSVLVAPVHVFKVEATVRVPVAFAK